MALAVYAHVPFCRKKCAYCDFVSVPGIEGEIPGYFDALMREWDTYRDDVRGRGISSVYIGGGTPSLVPPRLIAGLLDGIAKAAALPSDAEITMEANPGTVTGESLAQYRSAGINRLSLGAQSFSDGELKMLGRIHTADEILRAVDAARAAGFRNVSLDLIYELPGQTEDSWADTLRRAADTGVEHLSAYTLIVEDGTPLSRAIRAGELSQPDEEACARMREHTNCFLRARGFKRYEISNYARPGMESRHNLVYWERGEYVGIGCAAHSFFGGVRYAQTEDLRAYMAGRFTRRGSAPGRREAMEEEFLLRLRTNRGIGLEAFEHLYGAPAAAAAAKKAEQLKKGGLIADEPCRIVLTDRGMDVMNAVVFEFIKAIPEPDEY